MIQYGMVCIAHNLSNNYLGYNLPKQQAIIKL